MISRRSDVVDAIRQRGLPEYMVDGMERYLFDRIRPGDFMFAIVNGDFLEACYKADPLNALLMKAWAMFYMYDLPAAAKGSDANITAWLSGVTEDF